MIRIIVLLAVVALLSIGVTYAAHVFSKNSKGVKYLPGFAAGLMAAYYLYLLSTPYTGFQDIGRVIMFAMYMTWAVAGVIFSIIIDVRAKNRQK